MGLLKHYTKVTEFDPAKPFMKIDKMQKQNAGNCWIYSILNNLYYNTGEYVSGRKFEKYLQEKGYNTKDGNQPILPALMVCEYLDKYHTYDLVLVKKYKSTYYPRDFDLGKVRLFKKLLDSGVMLQYIRKSGKDLRQDIKDNDVVDNPISMENKSLHATNIIYNGNRIIEIGSWSDTNIYNVFTYKNILTFMQSIMNGSVQPVVRFIYPKQSRPYTEYRNKMLGERVDYDSAYGYQCVDLFKDYIDKVLGIKPGRVGNANEIWANKYRVFDKRWKQKKGTNNLMQGDVIMSLKGKYGHIGIVDSMEDGIVNILEQNGSGSAEANGTNGDEIRLQSYSNSYFVGAWRNKTIEDNYKKEVQFIKNKIETNGLDEETKLYMKSIRRT